jgi:hypothetical protein
MVEFVSEQSAASVTHPHVEEPKALLILPVKSVTFYPVQLLWLLALQSTPIFSYSQTQHSPSLPLIAEEEVGSGYAYFQCGQEGSC